MAPRCRCVSTARTTRPPASASCRSTATKRRSVSSTSPRRRRYRCCVAIRRRCAWTRASTTTTLARLVRHDTDGFNRWFAADALARRLFANTLAAAAPDAALLALWSASIGAVLADRHVDPALVAEILTVADVPSLTSGLTDIDPEAVHRARTQIESGLARALQNGAARTLCESRRRCGRCRARRAGEATAAQCLSCCAVPRRSPASRARSRAIRRSAQPDRSAGRARRAGQRRRHGRAGRARRVRASLRRRHDGPGQMVFGAGDARTARDAGARAGADLRIRHSTGARRIRCMRCWLRSRIAIRVRSIVRTAPRIDSLPMRWCGSMRSIRRSRRAWSPAFGPWRSYEPIRRALMRHELERLAARKESSPDLADLVGRALRRRVRIASAARFLIAEMKKPRSARPSRRLRLDVGG